MSAGVGRLNIRSINFDYEVTTDLRNSFLTSTFIADTMGLSNFDFFMYQVGLRRSPTDHFTGSVGSDGLGWMQYRAQFCREDDAACHELYRFDQSRGSWSARFSTALTIPEPIRINVTNVSYGWGREFFGQPDTTFIDTTIVLPEIRAAANTEALMKLSFVKSRMTRLTLNSSLNYRLARRENRERYDTTTTLEFQPLISLDGRFVRWPALSAGYRYSRGSVGVVTVGKGRDGDADTTLSTELTRRGSHALTLAYEFTNTLRFQELRLGGWVIPIQGKTNIGLTVNREHQVVRIRKLGDDDDEVRTDWDFNYSPFLEYMFTDNVRGSARYLGTHKYQGGRRINQQRFALSVEVTF